MSDDQDRGEVLWTPPSDVMRTTRLGGFVRWLQSRGRPFDDYESLWRWSVSDLDGFWSELREFADVGTAPGPALASAAMPGAAWFPDSTWNYAHEALRHDVEGPSGPLSGEPGSAVVAWSQTRGPVELSMGELRDQVARCRAGLVRLGVQPGDRVAAYLPNIPEAVVALLAVASIGAVWTSAPPEFGVRAVVDRFGQVEPVVLIAVEGYQYGGRRIDRRDHLDQLRRDLPTLRHTVVVSYPERTSTGPDVVGWDDLLVEAAERLEHQSVPFSHPLYVLYSSGTTGKPKAIVHGHGGIICEHVKALALHHDLGPGDRFFWYSTTGWMMWNYLVSGLIVGAAIVLFDGDPASPDLLALWRLASAARVTFMGLSAPFIEACRRAGVRPTETLDLAPLRAVGSTGAPLTAAGGRWVSTATRPDVQLSSISGGTDVCTAFVGGCPLVEVRAGEISCRYLGADVQAWDEAGQAVVGRRGELVVTQPMPSMPVALWGDADGSRLTHAYFEQHPGVWTHGDWITIHADGSCVITGRADATLNRGGVRLGTAEIYAVVDELAAVDDSLVVHLEDDTGGSGQLMLFVVVHDGASLDDSLRAEITGALRRSLSPRHAPDEIVAVPAIPRTLSGKRLEVPVKRILQGAPPDTVASRDTLGHPEALDAFVALARPSPPV